MYTEKAGDGTRTRDSLLGRQGGAESPLASSKMALQAHRTLVNKLRAGLTEDVPHTSRQYGKASYHFQILLPCQLRLFQYILPAL
jgi:DNA-binding FadR family transcriptional regulator